MEEEPPKGGGVVNKGGVNDGFNYFSVEYLEACFVLFVEEAAPS